MLKEILSFSKGILTDPEPQLRKLFSGEVNASAPAVIYILYVIAHAFFLNIKPPDFPAEFAALGIGERSRAFYFVTEIFWGTALTAASSALLLYFLGTFSTGKLFFKFLFWTLVMSGCAGAIFYAGKAPTFLLLAGALFFITRMISARPKIYWRFFQAALSLSLITAVVLPLEFAAVYLRSENLFMIVEMIAALWMIVLFTKTAKVFAEAKVPRAVISLVAGCLAALLVLRLFYGTGLISKEIYEILLLSA